MQTVSEPPTVNARGKWITTMLLLLLVAAMFALSYYARDYYIWSLFKPGTPGGH